MLWNRIIPMQRVRCLAGIGLSLCVAATMTGCDKVETLVSDAKKEIAEQTAPAPAPTNAPVAPVSQPGGTASQPGGATSAPVAATPTTPNADQLVAQFKAVPRGSHSDSLLAQLLAVPNAAAQITELDLSGSQGISGIGLQHVAQLPNLKSLTIHQSNRLTAADFGALKASVSLTAIDLTAGQFNSEQLATIAQIPNLERVVIAGAQVDAASIAQLAGASKLAELDANTTQIDDSSIAALKACPLRVTKLNQTRVTDASVLALGAIQTLEDLSLMQCQVTGKSFQKAAFLNLKKLEVAQTSFGPDGLMAIKKLKKLERLGLFGCGIVFDNGNVIDPRLNVLKGFPDLKELILAGNTISSVGLANLIAGHKSLEILHMNQLKNIGDPGFVRLVSCPNLKEVHVVETSVSAAGAKALKAKLPNVTVFGSFGKL